MAEDIGHTPERGEEVEAPADRYDPIVWHEPPHAWRFADVSIPGDLVIGYGQPYRPELRIRTTELKKEWTPLRDAFISGVTVQRGVPTTVIYRENFYAVTGIRRVAPNEFEYILEPWPSDEPVRHTYAYSREAELTRRNQQRSASGSWGLFWDILLGLPLTLIFGSSAERLYQPRQWDFYAMFRNGCLLEASAGAMVVLGTVVWLSEWFTLAASASHFVIPLKTVMLAICGMLFILDSFLRWRIFIRKGLAHALFGFDLFLRFRK
ncbi:MAG: hypothetical protein ACP5UB_06670 [Candidatus Sumerlaeaceae bacterium]